MILQEKQPPKLPRRYKGNVGKLIGGFVYVHAVYMDNVVPCDILRRAIDILGPVDFDIVKYNLKSDTLSFIISSDFTTSHEPTVGKSVLIKIETNKPKIITPPKDPWIYHHKWLMVKDDFRGFDVEQSKMWSIEWLKHKPDSSRIGKKSYWIKNVLPLL